MIIKPALIPSRLRPGAAMARVFRSYHHVSIESMSQKKNNDTWWYMFMCQEIPNDSFCSTPGVSWVHCGLSLQTAGQNESFDFHPARSESCTDDDINPQAVGSEWSQLGDLNGHGDMTHWQVYLSFTYMIWSNRLYDACFFLYRCWFEYIPRFSHETSISTPISCWLITLAEASSGSSLTWRKFPSLVRSN